MRVEHEMSCRTDQAIEVQTAVVFTLPTKSCSRRPELPRGRCDAFMNGSVSGCYRTCVIVR
jgi:hypothetical protein